MLESKVEREAVALCLLTVMDCERIRFNGGCAREEGGWTEGVDMWWLWGSRLRSGGREEVGCQFLEPRCWR